MKRLVIDIGNTITKVAEPGDKELGEVSTWKSFIDLADMINQGSYDIVGIASVSGREQQLLDLINADIKVITLSSGTPLPIKVHYHSIETLGVDRIAGVVGAFDNFPGQNSLVIDLGTCITYDFIDNQNIYHGGAISPGLGMRLKGMHQFTGKLPLIEVTDLNDHIEILGKSTKESLESGAFNGMLMEINGFISHFIGKYQGINIILTGGDSYRFESLINHPIFVAPKLVLQGLNRILDYNEKL